MLKKMESVFEKIGKHSFEHIYVTSGIQAVLSAAVIVLQVAYYVRKNRQLGITK